MTQSASFLERINTFSVDATEAENRSVVIVIDQEAAIGPDLRWPLRMAKLHDANISVMLCKKTVAQTKTVELLPADEQPEGEKRIAERMRTTLDTYLGAGKWVADHARADAGMDQSVPAAPERPLPVRFKYTSPDLLPGEVGSLTHNPRMDLVLIVGSSHDDPQTHQVWLERLKKTLSSIACAAGVVIPGKQTDEGGVMVGADRGPLARNAIELAAALANRTNRRLTGVYVEPDIGPDSLDVGRQILDRLLRGALDAREAEPVSRQVTIHNDTAKGIVEASRQENFDLLVLGATRLGAMGQPQSASIPNRVLRSRPEATLAVFRNTVPLRNRLQRWILRKLQRHIPQLGRTDRIDLVTRIQSNAHWNIDFILLMALASLIATLGLLDDSPAVIIGAMLVAPLMTPLIGLGLAIAQGNASLARMTLKAALLGFLTAFALAVGVGFLSGEFQEATSEMSARDWPQFLDLIVAFISGIAAAYASARPNLLAALPGVAIAAALVPPVATAGLATAIGNFDLAFGALLLFAINMVFIVLAAATSLWAVGIRSMGKTARMTLWLRRSVLVASIIIAIFLTVAPPRLAPPVALIEAVEEVLADEYRLRDIRLRREPAALNLQVDLGGTQLPELVLRNRLHEVARTHMGGKTGVRLTFRYETLVK